MKRRLFGIVLIASLMLIPSLASAASYPMDGTYIGAASIVAPPPPATPEFLMTFADYTAVIGGGGTTF